MLLQRKKANSFVPAIFSTWHGLFRKKGGTGAGNVFIFPVTKTPLPRRDFGPPPPSYGTFSTTLRCHCSVFPVQKATTEQTRSSYGRARSLVRFPPPIRFAPPPISRPNFEANCTRKFTRKFGEISVANVLWGTFSVPDFECLTWPNLSGEEDPPEKITQNKKVHLNEFF